MRRYVWILIYFIFYDKLFHRGITWFYGDVSNVVLQTPLWTDQFRGRIEGWTDLWCGWRFNHDGWVKWGCHDIVTWLTQANTSVGYKSNIFMFIFFIYIYSVIYIYNYYVYSVFSISIYIYICIYSCLILEKLWWTLVSSLPDELEKVGQPEKKYFEKEI